VPHFRLGKKLLFKTIELDQWMESHREHIIDLRFMADEAVQRIISQKTED